MAAPAMLIEEAPAHARALGGSAARAAGAAAMELRAWVEGVVRAELVRLRGRRTGLTDEQRAAVAETLGRVADGLLGPAIARLERAEPPAPVADLFAVSRSRHRS